MHWRRVSMFRYLRSVVESHNPYEQNVSHTVCPEAQIYEAETLYQDVMQAIEFKWLNKPCGKR